MNKYISVVQTLFKKAKGNSKVIVSLVYDLIMSIDDASELEGLNGVLWQLMLHDHSDFEPDEYEAFEVVFNIIADRKDPSDSLKLRKIKPKSHYIKFLPTRPGTIPKPTEIDRKTAKRPKRRGLVEHILLNKINEYPDTTPADVDFVKRGIIAKAKGDPKKIVSIAYDTAMKITQQAEKFAEQLGFACWGLSKDANYIKKAGLSVEVVASLSIASQLFLDRYQFLHQDNLRYKKRKDFYLGFTPDKAGSSVGSYPKPTDIDRKVAKRPRRRSVAEAILGGVYFV